MTSLSLTTVQNSFYSNKLFVVLILGDLEITALSKER